jgi:PhzF family phenazine biosynthesis protein
MMKIPIYQVDAFTNQLFGGNPAAVCLLDYWLEDKILQNIGAENNLAETAFLVKNEDFYEIRWFTPKIEIDLCGHATLASAHVLFNHVGVEGVKVEFKSIFHGMLSVTKSGELLTLNFPASEPLESNITKKIKEGLGKSPQAVYKTRDLLAIFETEEDILKMNPNFEALKILEQLGIIVSAPGNSSDFVSRFFAPNAGINEDPVTGSAHTTLIPYWAKRLGKNKLHAFQLSERKGELFCEQNGNRVLIGGKAKTFLIGDIYI